MATRPSLDLTILGTLADQPLHGYELKKRLTDLLGPWSSVSFGSLYPALSRLESAGAITAVDNARRTPGSGSLNAELAAFRRSTPSGTSSRRGRKAYAITDRGRARLAELVDDASGDDRAFAVRVAFAGVLDPPRRRALFERRRSALVSDRRSQPGTGDDRYRTFLREFQNDRVERELAWLERLIAAEPVDESPSTPTTQSPMTQEGTLT